MKTRVLFSGLQLLLCLVCTMAVAQQPKLEWAQHWKGVDNVYESAAAIAVDAEGNSYVTGTSSTVASTSGVTTIKYSPTGEQLWVSMNENLTCFGPISIAVDNQGGVYILGATQDPSGLDFGTIRYDDATVEQTWFSRYDGTASSSDSAAAIVMDMAGGVYVTGVSYYEDQNADFATVRYAAATGEQIWAERYNSAGTNEDVAVDMALAGEGDLVITGYSYSPETLYDFLTLKYSQQEECPDIAETSISGYTTVSSGLAGAKYSLPASGATSYNWTITDMDGSAYTDFTGQGTGSISVDWPEEPNAYKLSVTYGGKEGCPSQTAVLYVHLYDPEAGFVSGGGWSDSPVNSEYELMQRGGKLYWGFVARYRNENQVQGSAVVVLETGPSVFSSTSMEEGSLVIAGNRAFFRGTGTLTWQEGLGTHTDSRRFGYLVAATDGQLGAASGPNQLRLMIWMINGDGSEGAVVYDNQTGCTSANSDKNSPACAAIDRGTIIINKQDIADLTSLLSLNAVEAPSRHGLQAYLTAFNDRTTLTFTTESDIDYLLELYDLKGALVQRIAAGTSEAGKRQEHELRAEGLSKGLYLARLSTGDKVQTVKLVLDR